MRVVIAHNQLAFSHLMYIPIILMGSINGGVVGFTTGLIAGLLVGPLMPYNTETGAPQYWLDWVVRMSIMISVGTITGLFYRHFKSLKEQIIDMELKILIQGFII